MPLSEEYKKKIKESFDMDSGGRLRAIAQKAAAVNAPVLIIGLGGTGVDSLLITKKLIYDTIQSEKKSDGSYSDKPGNIEYLGIDTDVQYRGKRYKGIGLNDQNGEFMLYTMNDVTPILTHLEQQPPYIQSWLDTEIDTTTVINGAGAVRQLGRLMLMLNLPELQGVLKNKIAKVTNGYPSSTPMYVFVLAGISGGTGSGTFIDIPYMVKAIARTVTVGRTVQNIGILFMPDVNANRIGDENKKSSIYANGYAALKELDYLMNIERVGDKMEQAYGLLEAGTKDEAPKPPYDVCLLMSSKDRNGTQTGTGDENYENTIAVAAETVFNFVLGDKGAASVADFSIQSFLSNEVDNSITYQNLLGNQRRPVTYLYSIAGASSAVLPIDDIMSYLTYKAFQEIQRYWNQRPEDDDVDEILKVFKLTRKSMDQAAKSKVRSVNTDRIDYKAIKDNPGQVRQMYEAALKKQSETVRNNVSVMAGALDALIADRTNLINQYFLDLNKGPVFAQQCLYSTNSQVKCVLNDLQNIANDLTGAIKEPDEINGLEQNAAVALNKIRQGGIFGHGADRDAYVAAMKKLYDAKLQNEVNERLVEFCRNAMQSFLTENNRIYSLVSDLMGSLVPLFDKYGAIRTRTTVTRNGGGETLSWNLIDTPEFIQELERRIAQMPEFAVDLQQVITAFYHYLFDNTELWSGDRKGDVIENINGFIYRQFQNILDHSMDFFLQMIAESNGMTLGDYCNNIIAQLRSRAEVRFPIGTAIATGTSRPGYSFISVPDNSPRLFAAAQNVAAQSLVGGAARSIVKKSGIRDRIFMMNFESATPLSIYSDVKIFYDNYKMFRNTKKGLHLFKPNAYSEVDWTKLPSPYPETEWSGFNDQVEHQRNEEYREILAKALKYGYVTVDPQAGKMTCQWGVPADWKAILQKHKINPQEDTPLANAVAKRARKEIHALISGEGMEQRMTQSLIRTDMTTNEEHTELNQTYMEMIFIQLFKPREAIREMVENHEECLEALAAVKARMVDDTAVSNFVLCRMLGLIKKDKLRYIYLDRKGDAQLLTELTPKQVKFGEHYLLSAYNRLEGKIRSGLDDKADSLQRSTESSVMKSKLENYSSKMVKEQLADLQIDWEEIDDGAMLLASYHLLKDALSDLALVYEGGDEDEDEEF